jgi:hypothetical protein
MSDTVIKVENLWKQYRYGVLSHRTLHKDLQSWWARVRGKPDPNSRIGDEQSAKCQTLFPKVVTLCPLPHALRSLLMTLCAMRHALCQMALCQMLTTASGP